MQPLTPPVRLRAGDAVAIVAPAGHVVPQRLDAGLDLLRSWGLDPICGRHVFGNLGYLSGTDDERLADLQWALDDPAIRGVVAARGGYGTQRIVDRVDLGALGSDPKPIIGFSDITALHLAVHRRAGVVTFHGPGAAWDVDRLGSESAEGLRRLIMDPDPPRRIGPRVVPLTGGVADGVLAGGNLSLLAATTGTADQPDLAGAIVVLEDVGEPTYRIDRMLTHLLRAGMLGDVAGIVLGETAVIGKGPAFVDVAFERLANLGVPIVGPLPIGHGFGQLTVPLGVRARLDDGLFVDGRVTVD